MKSESEVSQSCPTLSDPVDCSLPGSSVHGIFQARVLEWGAIAFPNVLFMFVITFLPRGKCILISWLQSPLAVILEPRKIKSATVSIIFPGDSNGKASVYNEGDPGSIPGYRSSPGEKMATHSSTLAWKIPWMEEPGRLQSMG